MIGVNRSRYGQEGASPSSVYTELRIWLTHDEKDDACKYMYVFCHLSYEVNIHPQAHVYTHGWAAGCNFIISPQHAD